MVIRNKFTKVKTAKGRKKSSTAWLQRQLNDPYVLKARQEGYRSRAAYKLIQINEKFKLLKKNKIIIDLGATPGGWSQVAVEIVGENNVIAVDILPMESLAGVQFVQQDFLADDAHEVIIDVIKNELKQNRKCDVVLSDMAANSSGDAKTDHLRIITILEESLEFSKKILAKEGSFVGKVFQGGASADMLAIFRENFKNVKHFKPDASRKKSAENYIIAQGFKGS
jgi:23S rRNA (uridine2552-2'-O)-methyltransferase